MKNKYYFSFLLFLSTFTHAQDLAQYSDISSISQIASNQKIQTELQKLLKHDYQNFQSNFEHYSAPYLLKTDEALYYEGSSASNLNASSAIIFKDGRLFAAIYLAETKTLKYFSNDASWDFLFAQIRAEMKKIIFALLYIKTGASIIKSIEQRHLVLRQFAAIAYRNGCTLTQLCPCDF